MSRLLQSVVAGAFVALSILGVGSAAAVAAPAPRQSVSVGASGSDVSDFSFQSYEADFYLDTDADGRSTLTTVETFVALFPDINQNRGMKRAIPGDYQGAPTDVAVQSVTDENGDPRPYTVETDDDGFIVVTSAAKDFVHGPQTYVFTYTQHNVTGYFADTDDDEFYWDTNGTGWDQSFATATSRIHVPAALAASLTGSTACYRGFEDAPPLDCEITQTDDADGTVFTASAANLAARENVTVAIGFTAHTFVPREDAFFSSPFSVAQLLSVLGGLAGLVWAIVVRRTSLADGKGRPTIIAEYAPPANLDLFTAAAILGKTSKGAAAQIVDLAVTKRVRVIEKEKTGWLARGVTYLLELVDGSGLTGPRLALAQALFGQELAPGTGYLMSGKDTALSLKVRGIVQAATAATTTDGLRKKGTAKEAALPVLLATASGIGAVVFGGGMLADAIGGGIPFLLLLPPVIGAIVVLGLMARKPVTEAGAELRDHLKGLELYIRLAEADRLRMLQSPTGAEKAAVAVGDSGQIVKIYEKLLPYAVLFGLEKDWAEELGKYYVESSPEWYSGTGAFNSVVFASGIGALSSTVSSSYSGSASSSSSGGSGGGGSSGGGGGGGGGGGV